MQLINLTEKNQLVKFHFNLKRENEEGYYNFVHNNDDISFLSH